MSDRNRRVRDAMAPGLRPGLCGTGNICSGRMIVEYARRGCEAVQLHTFFQLPLSEYPATHGSRTQRALHKLIFDPADGLVACLLELEDQGTLERRGGGLRLLVPVSGRHRPRQAARARARAPRA